MSDEVVRPPIALTEFSARCTSMFEELADMLESYDDDTDPVGIANIIVARYLAHYLDGAVLDMLEDARA